MSAMEKVAWTEVIVSGVSCLLALGLYPWFGEGATAAFGFMGFVVIGMVFLRRRGDEVVMDERDRQIEREATFRGVNVAWMGLFLALIAITVWHGYREQDVPVQFLVWLIWLQFAVCYGVKGLVAVRAYRSHRRAAQS